MSPSSSPFSRWPLAAFAIQRELEADEIILWTSQPDPAQILKLASGYAVFGALFLAFSLLGVGAIATNFPMIEIARLEADSANLACLVISLCGVAFSLILMSLPLWERERARRTFYALTDRRALIVVEGAQGRVKSVAPAELALELTGRGDLILQREITGEGEDERTEIIGFFGIENAREVERLARELAQGAR